MASADDTRCPCGAPAGVRCRTPRCLRNRIAVGSAGDHAHSISEGQFPSHSHTVTIPESGAHSHSITAAQSSAHSHALSVPQSGVHVHAVDGPKWGGHVHGIGLPTGDAAMPAVLTSPLISAVDGSRKIIGSLTVNNVVRPAPSIVEGPVSGGHTHDLVWREPSSLHPLRIPTPLPRIEYGSGLIGVEIQQDFAKARSERAAKPAIVEGSIVRFKSGGPRMTVADIRLDGVADLVWFGGSEETGWGPLHRHSYPVEVLELADS